jgi:hypothetical protein
MTGDNQFSEYHRAALGIIAREREAARTAPISTSNQAQVMLSEKYFDMLGEIGNELRSTREDDPKAVFASGVVSLEKIEAFRFVLQNLLEAVKEDRSLQDSLAHYGQIGLLDGVSSRRADTRNSPWASNDDAGRFVRGLWKGLKKVALAVMEIMTHAVKAVPRWVAFKPSIGLAGMFPSFHLELDAESVRGAALRRRTSLLPPPGNP